MILPELLSILPNSSDSPKNSGPDVADSPNTSQVNTNVSADSPKIEFIDRNELPEGKLARSKRSGFLDAESLYRQAEMFMQPDGLKRFKHFYKQQIDSNDRYGCHCQMKDLVSQDYIDYEYEEKMKKQFPYSGTPVDDLDRACHNHRECLRCAKME